MRGDLARDDVWSRLRARSPARIGVGHIGGAMPTQVVLDLQRCHAAARDAVHDPLKVNLLAGRLAVFHPRTVQSRAPDRQTYIRRPDLGRLLSAPSAESLSAEGVDGVNLALVICDGLSPIAVERHAPALVEHIIAGLPTAASYRLILASQGRVALGDDIAERLKANFVVVLIGERPGLTVIDSLGAYLTLNPKVGRLDSERNCVSNIRPSGMPIAEAAARILWLYKTALVLGTSGTSLKDDYRPEFERLA